MCFNKTSETRTNVNTKEQKNTRTSPEPAPPTSPSHYPTPPPPLTPPTPHPRQPASTLPCPLRFLGNPTCARPARRPSTCKLHPTVKSRVRLRPTSTLFVPSSEFVPVEPGIARCGL